MYPTIKTIHYTIMIFVLVMLLYTVARTFVLKMNKKPFSSVEEKLTLISLILVHTQVLVGIVLYVTGPWTGMFSNMGEVMKDSYSRMIVIEHPLTMLIAAVLVTIGRSKLKRITESDKKIKNVLIFFGIALLLIIIRIPWQYING
mgnify:CR=1 FL=1